MKLDDFTPIECLVQCLVPNKHPIIMLTLEILISKIDTSRSTPEEVGKRIETTQRDPGSTYDIAEHNLTAPDLSQHLETKIQECSQPSITPNVKINISPCP